MIIREMLGPMFGSHLQSCPSAAKSRQQACQKGRDAKQIVPLPLHSLDISSSYSSTMAFSEPLGFRFMGLPSARFRWLFDGNKNSASNTNNNKKKMIASNSKMLRIVRRTSMEVPNNEMSNVPNGVNTVKCCK